MTPEAFRAARKHLCLTQTGMAEAIGVGTRAIVRYEAGDREISRTVELLVDRLIRDHDAPMQEPRK